MHGFKGQELELKVTGIKYTPKVLIWNPKGLIQLEIIISQSLFGLKKLQVTLVYVPGRNKSKVSGGRITAARASNYM